MLLQRSHNLTLASLPRSWFAMFDATRQNISRGEERLGARRQLIYPLRGEERELKEKDDGSKVLIVRPSFHHFLGPRDSETTLTQDEWYLIKGSGGIPMILKFNWRRVERTKYKFGRPAFVRIYSFQQRPLFRSDASCFQFSVSRREISYFASTGKGFRHDLYCV